MSALYNHFGCRKVTMLGAIIAAIGFALSSLAGSVEVLILTYGIIGGTCIFRCLLLNSREISIFVYWWNVSFD